MGEERSIVQVFDENARQSSLLLRRQISRLLFQFVKKSIHIEDYIDRDT
jgi:hypothetical protein